MMKYMRFKSVKRFITGFVLSVTAIWLPFIIASGLPSNFANTEWYGVPMIISMLVFGTFGIGYGVFLIVDGCTNFNGERNKFIRDHKPVGDESLHGRGRSYL